MAKKRKRLNKNLVVALTAFGFLVMTTAGILMVYLLQDTSPERFTVVVGS